MMGQFGVISGPDGKVYNRILNPEAVFKAAVREKYGNVEKAKESCLKIYGLFQMKSLPQFKDCK